MEQYPIGYPQVSAVLNSDNCFSIFRRFGYLHSRLLIQRQDELRELEKHLADIDEQDWKGNDDTRECLQSRELDECRQPPPLPGRSRQELIDKIEDKTLKYGNFFRRALF